MSSLANPTYTPIARSTVGYSSFKEFYPYYLGEHSNATCRTLHIVGTTCTLGLQSRALLGLISRIVLHLHRTSPSISLSPSISKFFSRFSLSNSDVRWFLGASIIGGYAFAWVGHFFFEKNKPATFKYPIYSLRGDYKMWWQVVTGQRALYPAQKQGLKQ